MVMADEERATATKAMTEMARQAAATSTQCELAVCS